MDSVSILVLAYFFIGIISICVALVLGDSLDQSIFWFGLWPIGVMLLLIDLMDRIGDWTPFPRDKKYGGSNLLRPSGGGV